VDSQKPPQRPIDDHDEDSPIAKLCDGICAHGGKEGFSLIHLGSDGHVRAQSNRGWEDVMNVPLEMVPSLVRRLASLAQLNADITTSQQEGLARFLVNGQQFDIRVTVRRPQSGGQDVLIEYLHAAA